MLVKIRRLSGNINICSRNI